MGAWDDALAWMDKYAVLLLSMFGLVAVGVVCLKACRAILYIANGLYMRAVRRLENKTQGRASLPALVGGKTSTPESDTKGDRKEQQQRQEQESAKIVQRIDFLRRTGRRRVWLGEALARLRKIKL